MINSPPVINRPTTPAIQPQNVPKGPGGNDLGATGLASTPPLQQQTPPLPPLPLQPATVMVGRSGRTHVVPTQDTTVRELAQHFARDAARHGRKELRFAQSPGYQQPTLHIHKGAISGWGRGEARAQKKADAAEVVAKAIDREVGRPGVGKALLRQLEQDGTIRDAAKLKLRDLTTIAGAVDQLKQKEQDGRQALRDAAPDVADIVRARAQLRTDPPSKADRQDALRVFNATPIPIGKDAQFSALGGGAWGAMKVKGEAPDQSQVAFALKTEDPVSHEKVRFVGGLFQHVEANATRPLPLGFMKTQVLERGAQGENQLTRATQDRMLDAIDGMIERGEGLRDGLQGGSEGWKAVLDPKSDQYNGGLVTKTEWVGGSMLRDFSPDDKLGLIKSGALAEDLAHAAVLGPMFGLTDHAGLGLKNGTGGTNLSNFRMGEDGRLTAIDFDAEVQVDSESQVVGIGKSPRSILGAYESLIGHLHDLARDPDPAARIAEGIPDKGRIQGPLKDVVSEALRPRGPDQEWSLLTHDDVQALGDRYTQADRVGFTAQLTLRTLDSLQYLSDELDTFEAAHRNSPKSALNQNNFFGDLRQLLSDADLPGLRARLGPALELVEPPPFQG
ncbi:MAG TPA: hypothetical protein VFG43_02745 [Geminicoccaceae bacterium]|nr:hypothetical protein [Geminicoccaceae bacterium]